MEALVVDTSDVPEDKHAAKVLGELKDGAQTVYFLSGGCWCYLRTPPEYRVAEKQACVFYVHGSKAYVKDGETDFTKNANSPKIPFVNAVIDAGMVLVASDASGETWGGPAAIAANVALYNDLITFTNIGKGYGEKSVAIWGGGFGGATAMNLVTGPFLGRVNAVVVMQAVLSYKCVIDVNLQPFKDNMLAAFGIPPAMKKDAATTCALEPYDPLERAKAQSDSAKAIRPYILVIHGDADDHIVFEGNAVRFHEEFGEKSTIHPLPGVKHGVMVESVIKPFQDFLIKHVGPSS